MTVEAATVQIVSGESFTRTLFARVPGGREPLDLTAAPTSVTLRAWRTIAEVGRSAPWIRKSLTVDGARGKIGEVDMVFAPADTVDVPRGSHPYEVRVIHPAVTMVIARGDLVILAGGEP